MCFSNIHLLSETRPFWGQRPLTLHFISIAITQLESVSKIFIEEKDGWKDDSQGWQAAWLTVLLTCPWCIWIWTEDMTWSQAIKPCYWNFKHHETMFKHCKTMGEILWTGTLSSDHLKSVFPENCLSHLIFQWALKLRRKMNILHLWEQTNLPVLKSNQKKN